MHRFKRTWVVQELCWARDVVYLIGEAELSTNGIVKSFEMAKDFVHSLDHSFDHTMSYLFKFILIDKHDDDEDFPMMKNWGSKYGPIWFPQILYGTWNIYKLAG
jgi:hypothetical protein